VKTLLTFLLTLFVAISTHAGNIADDVSSIETGDYAGGDWIAQLLYLVIGAGVVLYLVVQEHDKWKK